MTDRNAPGAGEARGAAGSMMTLLDNPVRYDLAESTCAPLRLGEIADPEALAGVSLDYGTSGGDAELRALVAADSGLAADQVLLTIGAIQALYLVAQDRWPGRVLLTSPCFPPTRTVPERLGSPVDVVPLRFDDGYRLPVERIARELSPSTRLVSIASPQNPSGVRFTEWELRDLLAAVEERAPEALVLVDETYRASTYGAAPVPGSVAAISPRIVTCSSLSKAHGAPGLRIGWLTTMDTELYERLRGAKFLSTVSCPAPDEYLAAEVLRRSTEILAPRAAMLADALEQVRQWAADRPVELINPDGGAMCCVRLRVDEFPDADVPAFYDRLAERDTRVAPGSWFGEDDRVFRLGFGHLPVDDLTVALDRLGDAITTARRATTTRPVAPAGGR